MENNLITFDNQEFGNIRVTKINNEPWFIGKDVAETLGYQNPSKAIADHVDDDDKLNNNSLSSLGQRGGWIINESGLYSLIMSSKLPSAKKFKRWVTSEVLPQIRRTGSYTIPKTPAQIAVDEITAVTSATQQIMAMIPSMKNDMAVITAVDIMKPTTTHIDTGIIVRALPARNFADAGTYTPTDMGKIIGNKSAQVINQALADLGFQMKVNKNWKLTECGTDYGETIPFGAGKYAGFRISWNEKALNALKKYFNI